MCRCVHTSTRDRRKRIRTRDAPRTNAHGRGRARQTGVIAIPKPSSIGLCAGVTNANYATTTEVYPDSPKATEAQCNLAQVACIEAGLEHIIAVHGLRGGKTEL